MKYIILTIGFISLALGIIGIFIVLLPTTPFLLLSGVCFAKSSTKVNEWFKNTKIYKQYIESYVENRSMTKKRKISLLAMVTVLLLIGIFLAKSIHLKTFMGVVLLAHYYYFIFRVNTAQE